MERHKSYTAVSPEYDLQASTTISTNTEPNTEIETPDIHDRYKKLSHVLNEAYEQAVIGKGCERHDDGEYIENQHTLRTGRTHTGFLTGQASKKIEEQVRLPLDRQKNELLGAINYCAFQIILINEKLGLDK